MFSPWVNNSRNIETKYCAVRNTLGVRKLRSFETSSLERSWSKSSSCARGGGGKARKTYNIKNLSNQNCFSVRLQKISPVFKRPDHKKCNTNQSALQNFVNVNNFVKIINTLCSYAFMITYVRTHAHSVFPSFWTL